MVARARAMGARARAMVARARFMVKGLGQGSVSEQNEL